MSFTTAQQTPSAVFMLTVETCHDFAVVELKIILQVRVYSYQIYREPVQYGEPSDIHRQRMHANLKFPIREMFAGPQCYTKFHQSSALIYHNYPFPKNICLLCINILHLFINYKNPVNTK